MRDGIFLGLVTHPATRFPSATSAEGILPKLQAQLEAEGLEAPLVIHDTDDWSEDVLRIDRNAIEESIDAELEIEKRWRRYVDPTVPAWFLAVFMGARRLYRRRKFLSHGRAQTGLEDPGVRMVRRLVNIEIAHMSLLRQAVGSECQWTLIVEDDAVSDDVPSLARELAHFIKTRSPERQPKYVNVSQSFNQRRLRVKGLTRPVGTWGSPGSSTKILQTDRPITNTVCAILYRSDFLVSLLNLMEAIPLRPVVPIDWKLNEAIMSLYGSGQLVSGDCWILDPAPIIQSSMRSGATS